MACAKPTAKMLATFERTLPTDARVERKTMFGCPLGFVHGNSFAWLHDNKIALHLPDEARERLTREFRAKAFEPLPGRVKQGWIVMPARIADNESMLAKWSAAAFAHVASLPVKVKKTKKEAPK
jgi:hypothetical protein